MICTSISSEHLLSYVAHCKRSVSTLISVTRTHFLFQVCSLSTDVSLEALSP